MVSAASRNAHAVVAQVLVPFDDQPGRCRRQAQRGADRANERLRIIKVGDDDAGGSRQQHDHAGRDG
jgi:hypothetical protein